MDYLKLLIVQQLIFAIFVNFYSNHFFEQKLAKTAKNNKVSKLNRSAQSSQRMQDSAISAFSCLKIC